MKNSTRKLSSGHFAFMRTVVQGIDIQASGDRYLQIEGEHGDLRKVKSTIERIRNEFAAAARQHPKPGTARVVLIDADQLEEASGPPSVAAFAAERGLEDFSEAEQQAAFVEAYGPGYRRRAKVAPRPPHPPPARSAPLARAPGTGR